MLFEHSIIDIPWPGTVLDTATDIENNNRHQINIISKIFNQMLSRLSYNGRIISLHILFQYEEC